MKIAEPVPKSSQVKEADQPSYIRWTPDTCPYALEMRLELITHLRAELDRAEQLGTEMGGVFIGIFPTSQSPTLRLDEVVFVPRDPDAGPEYNLEPVQRTRLAEVTAQARFTDRPVVGFFRSHLRAAPLAPSEADASMLSNQFSEGIYAFLLIGSQQPRQAALYLAMSGDLPESPSTPIFLFEESTFQSLPEIAAEATEDLRSFGFGQRKAQRPVPWAAVGSLVLLLFLVSMWTFGSHVSQMFRPNSNEIDLTVQSTGSNLKITWDHAAPIINKAVGATLVIVDGRMQREVRLDSDDLRLGQVAYERLTKKVYVVMRLDAPGMKLVPQTFDWNGN